MWLDFVRNNLLCPCVSVLSVNDCGRSPCRDGWCPAYMFHVDTWKKHFWHEFISHERQISPQYIHFLMNSSGNSCRPRYRPTYNLQRNYLQLNEFRTIFPVSKYPRVGPPCGHFDTARTVSKSPVSKCPGVETSGTYM